MCLSLFQQYGENGVLRLPKGEVCFAEAPWNKHPAFEGVELKHLVTSAQTGGAFSYHLVRIAPGMRIGLHTHAEQVETHEIIEGEGICVNEGTVLPYRPGVISIFAKDAPHEVQAGEKGLYLFAKFAPSLC